MAFFHLFREGTIKYSLFHLSWDEKCTKRKNLWNRLTPPPNTPNKNHKSKCYGPPTLLQSDLLTLFNHFTCAGIQPFLFPSVFPIPTFPTVPTCTAAKVLSVPHLPENISLYAGLLSAPTLIPELVIFPLQKANLLPEKKSAFLLLLASAFLAYIQ